MENIGYIIAWVAGLMVLIKLFQKEGLLKGIFGLICMLYTFIWGWMNLKNDPSLKNWMYAWTAVIVLSFVLPFLGMGGE